ncbi:endonuclease domain-containing protein [Adhaeribacter sp. BT258]|uniref:Endonuclease domain-containing protein n=1 Tax=Adhaeribacter terrigena TaxID=2793070 RepID=A0ABS1C035_9BACT|nr:endonuclease domain-containing protein [Adhaeribacter terrigena]MBK0402683.1 endonuclease domain-containing protein [Adhaeribacter terrigena]
MPIRKDDKLANQLHLKVLRKEPRNNLTPAEAALWKALQRGQLDGRKFRRQHSFGNYILDFYCPAEKLAVELDGKHHFSDAGFEADLVRTEFLNGYGIRVLRFENKEVFENLDGVLQEIRNAFGK